MTELTRLNKSNQVTIPQSVVEAFPEAEYFTVTCANEQIVLTPVSAAEVARRRLAPLGLTEDDRNHGLTEELIAEAVAWARSSQ
ncbi:MAG: AbrB/MazE/SpoVT family DNA-binding domain-containing protein [Chloroflexi bacterium]|nr:AbrB/MazE/SpoVT family DNA-binding domain-containing protein [Chloroflexota bacterium]